MGSHGAGVPAGSAQTASAVTQTHNPAGANTTNALHGDRTQSCAHSLFNCLEKLGQVEMGAENREKGRSKMNSHELRATGCGHL